MVLNLCLNARDAMPQGGQLIIETWNTVVSELETLSALDIEAGDYVVLSVSDTGIGMEPSLQKRIFEPFFTTKEEGRGLGLATSYGIARGHQGAIHVYSEPGKGSTFKVYLPARTESAQVDMDAKDSLLGGSEHILVVDDEESVRAVVERILSQAGYTVLLAKDGHQAIDVYREQSTEIDLVILDIILPGIGGQEVFRYLLEINPQVRVLLSSGFSENGEATTILHAGAQGFLPKPFDLRDLLIKVRSLLDS
jgi:CheY-like chemotaxis protein